MDKKFPNNSFSKQQYYSGRKNRPPLESVYLFIAGQIKIIQPRNGILWRIDQTPWHCCERTSICKLLQGVNKWFWTFFVSFSPCQKILIYFGNPRVSSSRWFANYGCDSWLLLERTLRSCSSAAHRPLDDSLVKGSIDWLYQSSTTTTVKEGGTILRAPLKNHAT